MNSAFRTLDAADLSGLGDRPGRADQAQAAADLNLPSTESEQWRYSPIGDLDPSRFTPCARPVDLTAADHTAGPGGDWSARVLIVDGFLIESTVADGWSAKGLRVELDPTRLPDLGLTVDGSDREQGAERSPDATVFDVMHRAFSPGAVVITIPDGVAVDDPILIETRHVTPDGISFPHLVVDAGEGSVASVVELVSSADTDGLSVPVLELTVGPAANLRYAVVQETGSRHWQIGRQLSTVAGQATLATDVGSFGGRYARVRTDSRLVGRGATATMSAAYYGDGDQVHDFRVFQHHDARDTRSDLLFKGAQDDRSGSIYTGLIHIHEGGAGSNAFQTNRNVKLSDEAWAWSVPNLEIENNEVHCSHASTVSPVDGDQQFYLQARGVPPTVADRLIVAGFYREVIERMPAAIRAEVRSLVQAKLDRRAGRADEAGASAPGGNGDDASAPVGEVAS